MIFSKLSLDQELNASLDYSDGGWNGVVCQNWHIVEVYHHHLWTENRTKQQHIGIFFPFHDYSLKLRLYFRHSIRDTVHLYKYNMFFIHCLFGQIFLTDIIHTLKYFPLFVKGIKPFSAVTSQTSQVSLSCTQSVQLQSATCLTKHYNECMQHTHHHGT